MYHRLDRMGEPRTIVLLLSEGDDYFLHSFQILLLEPVSIPISIEIISCLSPEKKFTKENLRHFDDIRIASNFSNLTNAWLNFRSRPKNTLHRASEL